MVSDDQSGVESAPRSSEETGISHVATNAPTMNVKSEITTQTASKEGLAAMAGGGGGSCSDEGDTRSLSDPEEELEETGDGVGGGGGGNNKAHDPQSRDMADTTEPELYAPPSAPVISQQTVGAASDADHEVISSSTAAASKEDDETSGNYAPPPKFYRLNASIRDDNATESDCSKKESAEEIEFTTLNLGEGSRTDVSTVDPHTLLMMEDTEGTGMSTSCSNQSMNKSRMQRKGVRFVNVCIREYDITIGDNPYCSYGVPICLDWNHGDDEVIPIDFFEASHKRRRTARRMLLNSFQRRDMLWRSGYPLEEIEKAIKENDKEKFRRSLTLYFLPIYHVQEVLYLGAEKCFKPRRADIQQLEQTVHKQQMQELQKQQNSVDLEVGPTSVLHQYSSDDEDEDKPRRRLSFRSSGSRGAGGGGGGGGGGGSVSGSVNNSFQNDWSIRSGSAYSDMTHDRDDPYAASSNSRFREYSVRVDRGQHDKATEIILCNLQRPHMRAFHSSWFSFFIAFFMWFAITPLLSEVKATLNLSNADIWTSSLAGTAGTIIMRILIGPACDKFGARLCMAFILASAAIPCALTGLVETAQGLSIVRTFVGIAGSSFVACQYWTSQMFTREVAGTANALVAGWGNLGGGVTQLVMGSALFPLFELIFRYEDGDDPQDNTNSSELAWRTVFVVPAAVSLLTAYTIVYHADDSPKGDYRERVRQQEIMVVSPTASLCAACQNWNVWILLIQYAACFGVEVTMTNATALYFKDEFGQTTVSAAAIASVFGFMNLFARGLGGFGSDLFNAKMGMRGRMIWQTVTLFVEGIAVVMFGFADTLAGSIFALIFLSLMVQSAEGSTFGIVPYVDRRFTGSVVGWVGAGGNIGGACFSVLFIHYQYEKAFALMGLTASASAFLSCLMNCKKLTRNAETLGHDRSKRDDDIPQPHNEGIGMTRDASITFAQVDQHEK